MIHQEVAPAANANGNNNNNDNHDGYNNNDGSLSIIDAKIVYILIVRFA
jgi:hypothetical protein